MKLKAILYPCKMAFNFISYSILFFRFF